MVRALADATPYAGWHKRAIDVIGQSSRRDWMKAVDIPGALASGDADTPFERAQAKSAECRATRNEKQKPLERGLLLTAARFLLPSWHLLFEAVGGESADCRVR